MEKTRSDGDEDVGGNRVADEAVEEQRDRREERQEGEGERERGKLKVAKRMLGLRNHFAAKERQYQANGRVATPFPPPSLPPSLLPPFLPPLLSLSLSPPSLSFASVLACSPLLAPPT